jgi:hypothetical protein
MREQVRRGCYLGISCLGTCPPCCEGEYPEQCPSNTVEITLGSGLRFDERVGELEDEPHGREWLKNAIGV